MEDIYKENQQPPEYMEEGFLTGNLTKLIIGLVVIVLLVGVSWYVLNRFNLLSRFRNQPTSPTPTVTPTPSLPLSSPTLLQPTGTQQVQTWKDYSDSRFGYGVKIPQNWEGFKRAEIPNGYQYGIHPIGSADVPITINTQVNQANLSAQDYVNSVYGVNFPRQVQKVANQDAIVIQNGPVSSYFLTRGGNLYELSAVTTNSNYLNVFNQMLATFRFTR